MWFAPLIQLVGGQLQAQPLDTRNPYAAPSNPAGTIALVVGGVAVLGGLYYFLVARR